MWQRVVQWHLDYQREMIAALDTPPGSTPAGKNRALAGLSEVERRQLRQFLLRYPGMQGYWPLIIQPLLLSSGLGGLIHLCWPQYASLAQAVIGLDLLVVVFGLGFVSTWFNYRRLAVSNLRMALKLWAMVTLAAFVGGALMALVEGRPPWQVMERAGKSLGLAGLAVSLPYALLIGVVSSVRNREYEALNAQLSAEAERERLARQLSDSQLRLLQAQIEPHFLFNTLGAVQQLAEQGAPRAAALTANLIHFLRGSLSQMRAEQVRLADDFTLLQAYLTVMGARLGERLRFTLDLPAELADQRVPTMMLLTLVENAIKHGIEPALRGGAIEVVAWVAAGELRLRVSDTGHGCAGVALAGLGLANIRERLRLRYGDAAALEVDAASDPGFVALIRLPYQPVDPSDPRS